MISLNVIDYIFCTDSASPEKMKSMQVTVETVKSFQFDAVVVGGGPAGCSAAIACARRGVRTLLIEKSFSPGGMGTGGLVPTWCPVHTGMLTGSAREIFDAAIADMRDIPDEREEWVPIEAESLKRTYDRLLKESGAEVWFGSMPAAAVKRADGTIGSLAVLTVAGLVEVGAAVYIDCTGNADLARLAGAAIRQPSVVQPASLCFYLGNVNIPAFKREPILHSSNPDSPIHAIVADEKYPLIRNPHFCLTILYDNVAAVNAGYLFGADVRDPSGFARIMTEGRAAAAQYAAALAEYTEAFRNCVLLATAPLPGIRESVRIEAAYTLTEEDYLRRARFADAVARNDYYLDVHSETLDALVRAHRDLSEVCRYYEKGEYYEIPFRSLVSSVDNLLAAGRIIGCDDRMQGSVRTMPTALATGMAAGIAAAVAVRSGAPPARLGARTKDVLDACR